MQYLSIPNISITAVLDSYFTDRDNEGVNAIIIGANSGDLDDFLTPYLKKDNLKGLLLEPIYTLYKQLLNKYKDFPNLSFENLAINYRNGKSNK